MEVTRCCPCVSLKSGSYLFGIYFMANSLFFIFGGLFYFTATFRRETYDYAHFISTALLVCGLVQFIASAFLIYGTIKDASLWITCWIVGQITLTLVSLLVVSRTIVALRNEYIVFVGAKISREALITFLALVIVHMMLQIYSIINSFAFRRCILQGADMGRVRYQPIRP